MPSVTHRRLAVLEQGRDRRDVPSVVLMVQPLSAEDEVKAADYRRRGAAVLLISEDDARL